jgi:cyclophilin family peptidyl-prolyl cis-trans isomerase
MAQHKAPTAVTFAPVTEKSGLALFVERYWKLGVGIAILVTAAILFLEQSSRTAEATNDQSWDKLVAVAKPDPMSGDLAGKPADLLSVADQIQGTQAGPWALHIAAKSAANAQQYDEAKKILGRLRQQYPTHPLVAEKVKASEEPGAAPQSLVDQLESRVDAQIAWRAAHPNVFQNPELPADAPKVRIQTDKGAIVVGLYKDLAPKHVENFLKNVREGYYTGQKFHRVVAGSIIQSGDPNTVSGAVETWGQGGPAYKLDREDSGLKHFPGVLAAAKAAGDTKSSGSQFYITVADTHKFDGDYTVFGKVLEGMDVAHQIEAGTLVPGTDRPEQPVTIQSMEIVGGG